MRWLGSLHILNTNSRGASNMRVMTSVRSSVAMSLALAVIGLPLGLQFAQVFFEAVETLFPEAAIAFEPFVDALQRLWFQLAGAPLRIAAPADEPRLLQNLEVLGDGGRAYLERFGQFLHRGLTQCQPREDRAPRGVGEGREGGVQAIGHL